MIDADEFIYLPKNPVEPIGYFLDRQNNTITMKSKILTNKNTDDIIDNNIIDIARYISTDGYTKCILKTASLTDTDIFIHSPHLHSSEIVMDEEDIIHYHCWINERCPYFPHMAKIDYLCDFINKG